MIQFFRKIRRNLLSEGKSGKYLKYAIGEIVLVVIGILIALQINNRNEYLKESRLEIKILKEISDNLNDDLERLDLNIEETKSFRGSFERVLNHLKSNSPISDPLKKDYSKIIGIGFGAFRAIDSGYESLKSAGINKVKNDEIRKEISKLYGFRYKIITEDIAYYMDDVVESYSKFRTTLYDQFIIHEAFHSAEPIDIEKLRNNTEFINQLKQIIFMLGSVESRYKRAQDKVELLDELIKAELKSRT